MADREREHGEKREGEKEGRGEQQERVARYEGDRQAEQGGREPDEVIREAVINRKEGEQSCNGGRGEDTLGKEKGQRKGNDKKLWHAMRQKVKKVLGVEAARRFARPEDAREVFKRGTVRRYRRNMIKE